MFGFMRLKRCFLCFGTSLKLSGKVNKIRRFFCNRKIKTVLTLPCQKLVIRGKSMNTKAIIIFPDGVIRLYKIDDDIFFDSKCMVIADKANQLWAFRGRSSN